MKESGREFEGAAGWGVGNFIADASVGGAEDDDDDVGGGSKMRWEVR